MKPTVTIGICARNCETYIEDSFVSIAHQDFPREYLELVFVDDGSEDKTLELAKDCISKLGISAKILRTSWKGLGHARNMVIANAEGQYILWVDGDMALSKNFIAKMVEFMQKHGEVGIAKGKQGLTSGGNTVSTLETCSRAAGRMVNYRSPKARFKALGTGGSIYRVDAIRQVGKFDENLKGYGEDWDAEIRVRAAGWALCSIEAEFYDYERRDMSWKGLWKRYWLRGHYTYYFYNKNRGFISLFKMLPFAAFVSGFLSSRKVYRLTKRRVVFLLPFQHLFKMSAWYAGFIDGHFSTNKLGAQSPAN